MTTQTLGIHITFTEPVLGSSPGNPALHAQYVASKAPPGASGEEAEASEGVPLAELERNATSVFPRAPGGAVFCWDYQWRGFFKGALQALIALNSAPKALNPWNFRRAVDSFLFVTPRRVGFLNAQGGKIDGKLEVFGRPLRASTLRGDRIALAASESLPAGTLCRFAVTLLTPSMAPGVARSTLAVFTPALVEACLDYGKLVGFGQFRGGSFGRFTAVMSGPGDESAAAILEAMAQR